jgi:hypothetical protein
MNQDELRQLEEAARCAASNEPIPPNILPLYQEVLMEIALIDAFSGYQEYRAASSYEPQLVARIRAVLAGKMAANG